ncbi:zinc finger and BTB domain-containing protein 14-like [Centruroides sculpturatus]|uniref:zinc finger and BTB domain-containing protein 14-like n=1 Tax=Centruroides sculpturatus TaxID=218467 RepID=UPI000C6DDB2A|nr:zinc finger and BTB domain-containing protein 14-like [Centruroides sculpturatus]XP_023239759.1 zinc finger and BTB domain-containing protein 14-like [Centruroides sculpturatus]
MESQLVQLKWNDQETDLARTFHNLFTKEAMLDVTLVCEGKTLKAHKILLSASSPLLETLFLENPSQHPIVIVPDTKYSELQTLIDFIYNGEVSVSREILPSVFRAAAALQIKRFLNMEEEFNKIESVDSSVAQNGNDKIDSPKSSSVRKKGRKHHRKESKNIIEISSGESETESLVTIDEIPADTIGSNNAIGCGSGGIPLHVEYTCFSSPFIDESEDETEEFASPSIKDKSNDLNITTHEKRKIGADPLSQEPRKMLSNSSWKISENASAIQSNLTNESWKNFINEEGHTNLEVERKNEASISSHVKQKTSRHSNETEINDGTEAAEPMECYLCKRKFKFLCRFQEHMKIHCEQKPYQCVKCHHSFKRKTDLARHIRIHTKPLSCNFCLQKFAFRWQLTKHAKVHSQDGPFHCDTCREKFQNETSLQDTTDRCLNKKTACCEVCSKSFII